MRSFTHADLEICTRGPRLPGRDSAPVVSIDAIIPGPIASLRFTVVCTESTANERKAASWITLVVTWLRDFVDPSFRLGSDGSGKSTGRTKVWHFSKTRCRTFYRRFHSNVFLRSVFNFHFFFDIFRTDFSQLFRCRISKVSSDLWLFPFHLKFDGFSIVSN